MNIDKNDVDISKLFYWKDTFDIFDNNNNKIFTVQMRVAGDADINRARVHALRKSSELRTKLKTEGSDERLAFILDKETVERGTLVSAIIGYRTREYLRDAMNSVNIPYPVEPRSDASLEVQEEYQKEIDDYQMKVDVALANRLKELSENDRQHLNGLATDRLYLLYIDEVVSNACESEMMNVFKDYTIYLTTFIDEDFTIPLFESYEEFENLPPKIKDQFRSAYFQLEIDQEDLKK